MVTMGYQITRAKTLTLHTSAQIDTDSLVGRCLEILHEVQRENPVWSWASTSSPWLAQRSSTARSVWDRLGIKTVLTSSPVAESREAMIPESAQRRRRIPPPFWLRHRLRTCRGQKVAENDQYSESSRRPGHSSRVSLTSARSQST